MMRATITTSTWKRVSGTCITQLPEKELFKQFQQDHIDDYLMDTLFKDCISLRVSHWYEKSYCMG